jgi:putative hemolysin
MNDSAQSGTSRAPHPDPRASAPRNPTAALPQVLPELGPLPVEPVREGRYEVRAARTGEELHRALRLRYEVFNLELGEGLAASHATGLDRDAFDDHVHHLLVVDTRDESVIGTYRLQTETMAQAGIGFYCDGEYVLADLPAPILAEGVEVGRACIAREHRKQRVLFALWRGIAAYLTAAGKRYVFGVCSLSSQDPREGLAVHAWLAARGHRDDSVPVRARPGLECTADRPPGPGEDAPEVVIPPLFATYLRYRSTVYGPPVIDREFKTIDFLVVMDTHALDADTRALFFGAGRPPAR